MDEDKKKRVAELQDFIGSKHIDPDKFTVTVADCLLLLESQWEEFCAGSEDAFMIQREADILGALANREIEGSQEI